MADTTALKNRIRAAIKSNDNQEITGPVLQQSLLDIVDELNGATETEASQRQSADSTLQRDINTERQARIDADNALGQRITQEIQQEAQTRQSADTQLSNLITGIKSNIDNGYVYAGIATPSTNPVSGKVFYIATAAGTYTNFGGQVLTQGINILRYNGSAWSNQQVIGIDDEPTAGSNKLVKSGGIVSKLGDVAIGDFSNYIEKTTFDLHKNLWATTISYGDDGTVTITKNAANPGGRVLFVLPSVFTRISLDFDFSKNGSGKLRVDAHNGYDNNNTIILGNTTDNSGHFHYEGFPVKATNLGITVNTLDVGETLVLSNISLKIIGANNVNNIYIEAEPEGSIGIEKVENKETIVFYPKVSIVHNDIRYTFDYKKVFSIVPNDYRYRVYVDLNKLIACKRFTNWNTFSPETLFVKKYADTTIDEKMENCVLLCEFHNYKLQPTGLLGYLATNRDNEFRSILNNNANNLITNTADFKYSLVPSSGGINVLSENSFSFTKTQSISGYRVGIKKPNDKCVKATIRFDWALSNTNDGATGSIDVNYKPTNLWDENLFNLFRAYGNTGTIEKTMLVSDVDYIFFSLNALNVNDVIQITNFSITWSPVCSSIDSFNIIPGILADSESVNLNLEANIIKTSILSSEYEVSSGSDSLVAKKLANRAGARVLWKLPTVTTRFLIEFDYVKDGTGNIQLNIINGVASNNLIRIADISDNSGHFSYEATIIKGSHIGFSLNALAVGETMTLSNLHIRVSGVNDSDNNLLYENIYTPAINDAARKYNMLAEGGRVGYGWISDLHMNTGQKENNKAVLRETRAMIDIANRTPMDFVVIGGDLFDGGEKENGFEKVLLPSLLEVTSKCSKPVVFLSGNHDDNCYTRDATKVFSKGYRRDLISGNTSLVDAVFPSAEANYFYFDIKSKDVRVICLDYIDYPSGRDGTSWWSLSEQQVKWFCEVATNTSRRIIVFTHGCPNKWYNSWNLGDEGGYNTDLMNAIAAYNGRNSLSLYGQTYDFSTANGHITHIHSGHTHYDLVDSITCGGVPCIITTCAKTLEWNYGTLTPVSGKEDTYITPDAEDAAENHRNGYGYEFKVYFNRTNMDIDECAFDVISLNTDGIHTIRVGQGDDKTFEY